MVSLKIDMPFKNTFEFVIIFLELSTLISNILINDITVKLLPIIDEGCCWGGPDDLSSGSRSDKRFCPVRPAPGNH